MDITYRIELLQDHLNVGLDRPSPDWIMNVTMAAKEEIKSLRVNYPPAKASGLHGSTPQLLHPVC